MAGGPDFRDDDDEVRVIALSVLRRLRVELWCTRLFIEIADLAVQQAYFNEAPARQGLCAIRPL